MIGGTHGNRGVNVLVSDPIVWANRADYEPLFDQVADYQQELNAFGWYKASRFTLYGSPAEINEWLLYGLGRHIRAYNQASIQRFEGFANTLNFNIGGMSITIGPLLRTRNRASVSYTPIIDSSVSPPVLGDQRVTAAANNTESQELYGILQTVLTGAQCTTTMARQYRDRWLADHAWPEKSQVVNFGSGEPPSVTVDCLGYSAWLQAYVYNNTAVGTTWLNTRIQQVLAANPNAGMFSTDYSRLSASALAVATEQNENATAESVIQAVVAKGDSTSNRWLFGLRDNRQAWYYQAPLATSTPAYLHRVTDDNLAIYDIQEAELDPWDIEPGNWLFIPDLAPGQTPPTSRGRDVRYVFIESVKWSMSNPADPEINGQKLSTLPQFLARHGLGGASV